MAKYCFRMKLKMPSGSRLGIDGVETVLNDDGLERVVLSAASARKLIKEAEWLVVYGKGYATQDDAMTAALRWQTRLIRTFARMQLGADFGSHSVIGPTEPNGVIDDVHGTVVYRCKPAPDRMVRVASAHVVASQPGQLFHDAIRIEKKEDRELSETDRLAFELFNVSFFSSHLNTRFVLLVMAVEALSLVIQVDRSDDAQRHVRFLIEQTQESSLPESEIRSLVDSLKMALSRIYRTNVPTSC